MNRPSNSYWERRFELLTESLLNKGDKYYADLVKEYEKALAEIQRDIEQFYSRFATDNQISLSEARRLLNNNELEEFHWTIEEYLEKAIELADKLIDEDWIKELRNASNRVRISRLESLEYQIRQQIETISAVRLHGLTKLSEELIKEGYYRTIYEIQKGFGIGDTFGILDTKLVENIISKPWAPDGSNFSQRIWRDREVLMNELKRELAQSFIRGDPPDTAIRNISKKMEVSKSAAGRLVMTESAFFANEAREKAFRELDIKEYIFVATLDIKTSNRCREIDSKVFKLSEKQVGINWPPLHPNCRSTTAPYFEGNIKERWARDPVTGKGYGIPNMSYEEWYEKYVSNNPEAILAEKKWKYKHGDKKQYERYKKVLSKDLGVKSLDEFQNIKYNNHEKWNELKEEYDIIRTGKYLQEQYAYVYHGKKLFIPKNTTFETTKVIAGGKSGIELRIKEKLSQEYGGNLEEWAKKVGKIESAKYIFDMHWYELNGKQYEMKLKYRGDKK